MKQIKGWLIKKLINIKDSLIKKLLDINISTNAKTVVYFLLGMMRAWVLTAMFISIMQLNYDFNTDTQEQFTVGHLESGIPNAINTVQTIPVEVYKLEREE